MDQETREDLFASVRYGDAQDVVEIITEELAAGTDPNALLDVMIGGIQALGELFKDGAVFLPEVLISVRAMNRGTELLKPHLASNAQANRGSVVLGSVGGDIHDIGKNLVGMMLSGNGYRVIDLGVDVKVATFLKAIEEHQPDLLAMSGLLTTTIPQFSVVIDASEQAGLRRGLGVMVGGAPVTQEYATKVGADGWAEDCIAAIDEAGRLIGAH